MGQGTVNKVNGVRTFTWEEIEKSVPHKGNATLVGNEPVYTVINDKVYDLSGDFFSWHPGGGVAFSQLGKDATGAFQVFHRDETREILANFYVGDLDKSEAKRDNGSFAKDVQELRDIIQQSGWYASSKLWYARNIAQTMAMWGTAIFLMAKFPDSILAVLTSGLLVAVFWQQCGWLAHDFCHRQVFQSRLWNDVFGYFTGNVCQGFSVAWWKHKHCTHHSVPNVHNGDPDIDTLPFLAWSEHALEGFADFDDGTLAKFFVAYQPLLYFPLLSVARLNWAISSLTWNLGDMRAAGKMFPTRSVAEIATLAVHWGWTLGAPLYFLKPLYALIWFATAQMVCGVLLAAVFSVNHNGMPIYTTEEAKDINFYQLAILTGRDVHTNIFNDWFTGGLNMQIEHHMFPIIPRHNLGKVAPHVEKICKKNGIPYHSTTLATGLYEVVARLATVSKAARKTHVQ
ncbi:hypothetical protein PhCBS80983_g01612 [Powellomyces hirtus]|uniref:Cytochrome b5 heme-binding domain-containing protein n=1 Tax=Powellomyces hirtus TaxID=109895 RepID=A0A507E9X8_9FUNG|nr:hypothetical protein PhCBS80983_g01612 [Powellomyces hirtus]